MSTYLAATCVTESDGYHLHEYQVGITKVTEHLHTWIEAHLRNWPDSSRVYIGNRAYAGTVEQAWVDLTGQGLPVVDCGVKA